MAIQRDFSIEASSRRCHRCERPFQTGEEYFSAVVEGEGEDSLVRRDTCLACWDPRASDYYSFWKTRVPEPKQEEPRGPRLVDLDRLMQLFERLAEAKDPEQQRFRYVLALALMRKRRLKAVESKRFAGGGERLTVRETGTQRVHTVTCPSVTDEEIRALTARLREILDMPEKWEEAEDGDG